MPIKVEAAVVTQKKQNVPFNPDSVNINGKVLPHEVVQSGYKGTGVMSGTVFFAVSSSDIEGFADASVAAFNERADHLNDENADPSDIITGYFKDSVYALGEMGHRSSDLDSSILYAYGNYVILAKTGNTQLYAYSKNGFAKVTPALFANEDGASQYGLCTFPTVAVDDIFLLVSPGVTQVLTDKDLDDICKAAEGSVKKIVNLIFKVASVKQGSGGITAMAVKVLEADDEKGQFGFAAAAEREAIREDDAASAPVAPEIPSETGRLTEYPSSKQKTKKLSVAVLTALIIIALLACSALGFKLFGSNIMRLIGKEPATTAVAVVTTQKAAVTTTKPAVTTTNPVTTTTPVTTTSPVTTTAKPTTTAAAVTPTSPRTTTSRYEEEEENTTREEATSQEEENTTAETPTVETTGETPTEETPTEETPSSEEGGGEEEQQEEEAGN